MSTCYTLLNTALVFFTDHLKEQTLANSRSKSLKRASQFIAIGTIGLWPGLTQAIPNYVPGQVEPITQHYGAKDAEIVRNSFAVGSFGALGRGGCTGTWVGPNTVMTAAHCGGIRDNRRFQFALEGFPSRSHAQSDFSSRTYDCERELATGFWSSNWDFALWNCRSSDRTDLPGGLRYGYSAYEPAELAQGNPVYSLWRNPVTGDPTVSGNMTLFSPGVITRYGMSRNWAGPNFLNCIYDNSPTRPSAMSVDLDTYSNSGSSGSVHFDSKTHRIVIGPTATGTPLGRHRTSTSIATALGIDLPDGERALLETDLRSGDPLPNNASNGLVETRFSFQVNGQETSVVQKCRDVTLMQNLAEPDANGNLIFDVQEQFDKVGNEGPIKHYSFDNRIQGPHFEGIIGESERGSTSLSALGNITSGADVRVGVGFVSPMVQGLSISSLFMEPGEYSIGLELVRTQTVGNQSTPAEIVLAFECFNRPDVEVSFTVPALAQENIQLFPAKLDLPCGTNLVKVLGRQGLGPSEIVQVRSLSMTKAGEVYRFELMDERDMWRGSQSPRALFTADGRDMSETDLRTREKGFFALEVPRGTFAYLAGNPLSPRTRYRVTFDAKSFGQPGPLFVQGGGTARRSFNLSNDWQSYSWEFYSPGGQAALSFGAHPNFAMAAHIDNVSLERMD